MDKQPQAAAAEGDVGASGVAPGWGELEDPARAWIDLVEALALPEGTGRSAELNAIINAAKGSRWTHEWMDEIDREAAATFTDEDEIEAARILASTRPPLRREGAVVLQGGDQAMVHDSQARTKVTARAHYTCKWCGLKFNTESGWMTHQAYCRGK